MKFVFLVVLCVGACSSRAQVAIGFNNNAQNKLFDCIDESCQDYDNESVALYQFTPDQRHLKFSDNQALLAKRTELLLKQSYLFKNKEPKVERVVKMDDFQFKVVLSVNDQKGVIVLININD